MSHNTSPLVRNVSANNSSRSSSRSVELLKSFRPLRVAPRKMPSDKEPSDSKKHHEGDESESSDDETYTPRSHSAFRSNKTAAIDDNCPDSDGDTGDESDGVQTAIRIYDEVDENLEEVVIHVRSLQLDTNVDTYPTVRKVQSASGHRVREFWYGPELKSQSPTWFKVLNSSNKTLSLPWQLFPPGVAVRYQKNLPRGYTIHEHATDLEIAEDMHTHANDALFRGNCQMIDLSEQLDGHKALRSQMADKYTALAFDTAIRFVDNFGGKSEVMVPVPLQCLGVLCPRIGYMPLQCVGDDQVSLITVPVPDLTLISRIINVLLTGNVDDFFKIHTKLDWDHKLECEEALVQALTQLSTQMSDFDICFALDELLCTNFTLKWLKAWDAKFFERIDEMYRAWLRVLKSRGYTIRAMNLPPWPIAENLLRGAKDFDSWFIEIKSRGRRRDN